MKHTLKALFAFVVAAFIAAPAMAQDNGALVDALVKKGVLSGSEAEEIKADLIDDWKKTPSGKISLAKHITKLKLYGDVRVRYQWESVDPQDFDDAEDEGHDASRNRYRYRLRVGADYEFTDDFKAGVRFETGEASDSTNQTFGGFFSKQSDELYVGLAYLEWNKEYGTSTSYADPKDPKKLIEEYDPFVEITIRGGKHKHMWFIDKAWWDGDINPEGFSAKAEFFDVFGPGFDLAIVGGAYIVDVERNHRGDGDADPNVDDNWFFGGQLIGSYHFQNGSQLTIAPGIFGTTGGFVNEVADDGGNLANENESQYLHNFLAFFVPVEYKWKMAGLPWKIYGTFGINLDGEDRINDPTGEYFAVNQVDGSLFTDQDMFWQAGFQVGSAKKKGTWQIGAYYKYVEAGAWDTNLIDSDWNKAILNAEGFVAKARYAFTDFLAGTVTYMSSDNIEEDLITPNADSDMANSVQLLQVDLAWKF